MAVDDSDLSMMSTRERAICSSLCFCLALSVLSGVAMIYLSVIIYIPSQREMLSGFNEVGRSISCLAPKCVSRNMKSHCRSA